MAVGQSILTVRGSYALADASSTGKSIKPKFYKVSNQDIPLDPTVTTLTDLPGVWKQADISGYFPINDNTVEFLVDIPPEEATDYGKTFGLYLEDGTLFMIAKPPYPFPPSLRQTFKIQLVYNNANNLIDFQYIPMAEIDDIFPLFDTTFVTWDNIFRIRKDIELLKSATKSLFDNKRNQEYLLQQHSSLLTEHKNFIRQNIATLQDHEDRIVFLENMDYKPIVESNIYKVLYVDPVNGNDSNEGSQTSPLLTIEKAIYNIPKGGTGVIKLRSDASYIYRVEQTITIEHKHVFILLQNEVSSVTIVCF